MIKENDDKLIKFNYLVNDYKLDSTKNPTNQLTKLFQQHFEKIIFNNENLDFQYNLKLIDSIEISVNQINSEDLYSITTFLSVISLQMNYNPSKKEFFTGFIEKNLNSLKHEVTSQLI
jgi:hypothetical protein